MTVYNWSSMSPRERDALVAEKVMGWTGVTYDDNAMCEDWFGFESGKEDDPNAYWPVPHYTTDISAAWEVVEKMKHNKAWEYGGVDLRWGNYGESLTPNGPHGQIVYPNELAWACALDSETFRGVGIAKTAPEAICLAALKAVGVEIQ